MPPRRFVVWFGSGGFIAEQGDLTAGLVFEDGADAHADFDGGVFDVDEGGCEPRAFVQLDDGDALGDLVLELGRGGTAGDGEGVDGAVAGDAGPVEAVAEAVGAAGAGVVDEAPAVLAFLEADFVLAKGVPEGLS